jgi:hypothetical protein
MTISRALLSISFGIPSIGALPAGSLGERCPTPRALHSSFKVLGIGTPLPGSLVETVKYGGKLTDITDCKTKQESNLEFHMGLENF